MEGEQREPRRTRSTFSRASVNQTQEQTQQDTPMANDEKCFFEMEGEQHEPRRTRSTFSRAPVNQNQEQTQQDTPTVNDENRFYSAVSHSFDFRHWPSDTAPEKPSDSPVRNYIIYDSPPHKTELPDNLRIIMLYFDTQYKHLTRPKLLHVHIGTGEILLSEFIPATRRLWNKWLRDWLSVVHHTLVKFKPATDGTMETVEPHPDDAYFLPPPGPSHVWGSDIPGPRPCPRVSSPNRDDIIQQHFRNLRKEKDQRRLETRKIRQNKKGEGDAEGSDDAEGPSALSGHVERAGPDAATKKKKKKKNNRGKRMRQKKVLAKQQASDNLEAASNMTMGGESGNAQNQGVDSSGHDNVQNVQEQTTIHPSGSFMTSAFRTPLAEIFERHPNLGTPATGVNSLPIRQRPTIFPITPINGGSNARTVNTPVANEQRSSTSQGYNMQDMNAVMPERNPHDELNMAEDE